jgi:hypothetical protein
MPQVTLQAITPKAEVANVRVLTGQIQAELDRVGQEIKDDFMDTTLGWKHRVVFTVVTAMTPKTIGCTVSTDDKIYGYLSNGTKRHSIRATNAQSLRWTSPTGEKVFRMYSHHPGIKARNYAQKIARKYRGVLAKRLQSAIDNSVGGK